MSEPGKPRLTYSGHVSLRGQVLNHDPELWNRLHQEAAEHADQLAAADPNHAAFYTQVAADIRANIEPPTASPSE